MMCNLKPSTRLFVIRFIVTYSADRKELMPANIRYSKKSLRFIFYSLDETNDYEIAPVASFDPTLPDRVPFT